jgi:hypothetical protein
MERIPPDSEPVVVALNGVGIGSPKPPSALGPVTPGPPSCGLQTTPQHRLTAFPVLYQPAQLPSSSWSDATGAPGAVGAGGPSPEEPQPASASARSKAPRTPLRFSGRIITLNATFPARFAWETRTVCCRTTSVNTRQTGCVRRAAKRHRMSRPRLRVRYSPPLVCNLLTTAEPKGDHDASTHCDDIAAHARTLESGSGANRTCAGGAKRASPGTHAETIDR